MLLSVSDMSGVQQLNEHEHQHCHCCTDVQRCWSQSIYPSVSIDKVSMHMSGMLGSQLVCGSAPVGCLAGISRVGLKSLVESVRLQTLSRAGLQQLQLDVHYLRPLLRRCDLHMSILSWCRVLCSALHHGVACCYIGALCMTTIIMFASLLTPVKNWMLNIAHHSKP